MVKVATKEPKKNTKAPVNTVRRSLRLEQKQQEEDLAELLEGFGGDWMDPGEIPEEGPWTCDCCGHINPHEQSRCAMTDSVPHGYLQQFWNGPVYPSVCSCTCPIVPGAQRCPACGELLP